MARQREASFLSNQAQHQVIWLMSSASAAEGLLINETSCCDVWLEQRPACPSVKEVSESIRAVAPNSGVHSGHFNMGDFKTRVWKVNEVK